MSGNKYNDRMSPPPPPGPPPGPPRRPPPARPEESEYEEEFEIEITTQKGSSIKVETSSYDKLDDLLEKAFTTYTRLAKEESGDVAEKQQYQ
jgi:hypothetical protein